MFCLPHAGGGASAYHPMIQSFHPQVDVQPVQLPGREELLGVRHEEDLPSLAASLARSVAEAVTAAPGGQEFALFGHSMGATLAAEMTVWLARTGAPAPELLVVSARSGDPAPVVTAGGLLEAGLTDEELVQRVAALGGTAARLLADPQARALALAVLRRDLRMMAGHRSSSDMLDVPVLAVGGMSDPAVSEECLARWGERTRGWFGLHMLPGGHFYLRERHKPLLRFITEARAAAAASSPAGPVRPLHRIG
jgi:surfactin synthase thioesterase subunit